jgi:purine nucleoside permease
VKLVSNPLEILELQAPKSSLVAQLQSPETSTEFLATSHLSFLSEINAASTISALVYSPLFNFTKTYFFIAGIAGVNPEVATLGSVTFARFAVSVALQYEFDAREIPDNFTTGYVPQGSTFPSEYPQSIYGTEVFEVNDALRQMAISWASTAALNDSTAAQAYRANYASTAAYKAGSMGPSVVGCDTATSDVYFSGNLLSEAFQNTTALYTNGSGIYCTTAQEDTATLEGLLRGAVANKTDFSRIIVMRTASDFDRPYAGESDIYNLFYADQGGFEPAIENIYLAGIKVVEGILQGWETTFEAGVTPTNYIGDIFGTLGGKPDFGPGSIFNDDPVTASKLRKRGSTKGRRAIDRRRHQRWVEEY